MEHEDNHNDVCEDKDECVEVKDDFKSLDPRVEVPEDIWDVVGEALGWQKLFIRKTSPWEMVEWGPGELESYMVDDDGLDRVYYTYEFDGHGVGDREYTLLGRMRYGSRTSYFALEASCDFTGFTCQGGGYIYVTFDPQIFLKSVVTPRQNPYKIWTFMVEDGLKVDEPTPFDLVPVRLWKSVPMLKYLCHQTVYDHRDTLAGEATKVLPRILVDSIEEFIRTRTTRDHYSGEGEYEED